MEIDNYLSREYNINKEVVEFVKNCEHEISTFISCFYEIREFNQYKILKAMQDNRLTYSDFNWSTGYGYGDMGRDKAEQIYSHIFKSEDALVRPNIVSGTHAISISLFSLLKTGDKLMSISGTPYDTLLKVLGVVGDSDDTIIGMGVDYSEIPLLDGKINLDALNRENLKDVNVVMIQRSTGYSDRKALTIGEIEKSISRVKEIDNNIIVFVDNCYGEFTETREPIEVGADIAAGSLIKNPGGGLALSGGYVVGSKKLIDKVSNRLTAPGIGKDCGLTFGMTRQIMQGLFLAPNVVVDTLKGAILFSKAFEKLNYNCIPRWNDRRSDIIQAIELESEEKVIAFCKAIQESSPVDSFITPLPWNMPGYEDQVVMAAGGFIEGSSIELSADGPMREPYFVYFQGGLTYEHCKFALLKVLDKFITEKIIGMEELK